MKGEKKMKVMMRKKMMGRKTAQCARSVGVVALLCAMGIPGCGRGPKTITVGSKNFTEQVILGRMLSLLIENRTNLDVREKINLGGTFVCFNALKGKQLDMYVEYTGTGLTAILNEPPRADPDSVYDLVKDAFENRWDLTWLRPLGFDNTYALAMRRSHAESLGVSSVSELRAHAGELRPGFNHEFLERPDGYPGLAKHYGFEFERDPREMDTGLLYRAIAEGEVDVICAFATDGRIPAFDLVTLEDDKSFFPPYLAAPLVRADLLESHPEVRGVLNDLAGSISDSAMRRMNYRVDEQRERPVDVARAFLGEAGLL